MRGLLLSIFFLLNLTAAALAADAPERGGILTYLIPADGGPSFDGHKETTYAVLHATAPFYSTLIRVNPDNPASATDFVCDLCTEMPVPVPRLTVRAPSLSSMCSNASACASARSIT